MMLTVLTNTAVCLITRFAFLNFLKSQFILNRISFRTKEDEYGEELEEDEEPKEDYGYKSTESNVQNPEIDYNEETKDIIEKAKNAKNEFTDVESRHYQVENKIRELENSLNHDYGIEDEFMAIHGQCFDYTDREYTYRLCPFDRAAQISKNGGAEVNLG